jgi:hypothetical protein
MANRRKWLHGCIRIGLALALVAGFTARAADDVFTGVERVVAVGDVHGDYDQFLTVLRNAGVIDQKGTKWIGGKTHLVQTGDVLDRGGGSRKAMDLLIELEKQARKAGGAVHALIGNHEAMNLYGDLRYVTPEEYASYADNNSAQVRDTYWQAYLKQTKKSGAIPTPADRQKWEEEHPLGFFEQRFQFGPNGTYGPWIRGHNAVVQINDALFLHGGISPKYAGLSIQKINEQIRSELSGGSELQGGMTMDQDGPLWYRGLAELDERQLGPQVQAVLDNYHVRRIVIGHTPTAGAIMPRLGNSVLVIDVGMTRVFGGPPASLLLDQGKPYAIHRGVKLEIPSEPGEPRLNYLKECAKLEPASSKLRELVAKEEAAPMPVK